MKVRVGTRGSELALTQTRHMISILQSLAPELQFDEVILKTQGDQDQKKPLHLQGGVGLFTKELQRALVENEVDLAVHSLKDLPTFAVEGLCIGAIPERERPWDAWVSSEYKDLVDLPAGAKVATGSHRRQAQIYHRYPHLECVPIRGNIDTRIAKYSEVGASGVILAAAGLRRTGRHEMIRSELGATEMTPAPGQGALALETREDCKDLLTCLSKVDHNETRIAVSAERFLMAQLEGGCHLPIGAFARVVDNRLILLGMVADPDGKRQCRMSGEIELVEGKTPLELAKELALSLESKMRKGGAQEILDDLRE